MGQKRALKKAMEDEQAGKPAATQAEEFVLEEVREELRRPKSRRTLKTVVKAGLENARRYGITIPADLRLGLAPEENTHGTQGKREKDPGPHFDKEGKRAA